MQRPPTLAEAGRALAVLGAPDAAAASAFALNEELWLAKRCPPKESCLERVQKPQVKTHQNQGAGVGVGICYPEETEETTYLKWP